MQIAIEKEKFANTFSILGIGEMSHEVFSTIEEYVCSVHGFKCDNNINEVTRKMFEERSKPKSVERPLYYIKSLDPNKFLTCRAVPQQHIKMEWFITKLYKTAYMTCPVSDCTPVDYGWELPKCGNYLEINWFEGDQVPPEIESREETNIRNEEMFNEYDKDSDYNIYESDESDNDDGSDYDDF